MGATVAPGVGATVVPGVGAIVAPGVGAIVVAEVTAATTDVVEPTNRSVTGTLVSVGTDDAGESSTVVSTATTPPVLANSID